MSENLDQQLTQDDYELLRRARRLMLIGVGLQFVAIGVGLVFEAILPVLALPALAVTAWGLVLQSKGQKESFLVRVFTPFVVLAPFVSFLIPLLMSHLLTRMLRAREQGLTVEVTCPACKAKVTTSAAPPIRTPYPCTGCGARLIVTPGLRHPKVMDWQESEGEGQAG